MRHPAEAEEYCADSYMKLMKNGVEQCLSPLTGRRRGVARRDRGRRLNGTEPVPSPPQPAVPRETRIRRSSFPPPNHPANAA
jgi:hypothetical protein